jgi:hypothetical protein
MCNSLCNAQLWKVWLLTIPKRRGFLHSHTIVVSLATAGLHQAIPLHDRQKLSPRILTSLWKPTSYGTHRSRCYPQIPQQRSHAQADMNSCSAHKECVAEEMYPAPCVLQGIQPHRCRQYAHLLKHPHRPRITCTQSSTRHRTRK